MRNLAIFKTHPNVISIDGDLGPLDIDGNSVVIDEALVNAWVDPDAYKYQRAAAYPSIADQLDTLYHQGYDGWKATIEAVKTEFPKP